jgi:uncharacterized protein YycO
VAAQIRPNRLEVTDRFPMLGFTIRTDGTPQRAEVAVATDPSLFLAQNKAGRTLANFYSSHATGPLPVPRGEGIYVVPAEVLARFIGQERLYVALATVPERNGQAPRIDVMPGATAPYVSLRGLTGRSLRRMRVLPTRQYRAEVSAARDHAALEWVGDSVSTVAAPSSASTGGGTPTSPVSPSPPGDYDDGFGPMIPAPAPPPAPAAVTNGASNGGSVAPVAVPASAASFPFGNATRPGASRALTLSSLTFGLRQPASPPSVTRLQGWQADQAKAAVAKLSTPLAPALAALPLAAAAANVSIGVGQAVSPATGFGFGVGAGVVFGPDGSVGVYGAGDFQIGVIASISTVAQVTVVKGGIESFNGWGYAAAISGGEGLVGGAAALFDGSSNFQGVSLQFGIDSGLTPVDFYVAVQRQLATNVSLAQGARAPMPSPSAAQRALALAAEIPLDPGNGGMSIGLDALEIGDVIVSTTSAAVSRGIRFATGSEVSHAMLYVGQGGQVIDATGEGARLRALADALGDATLAVAFRRPALSDAQRQIIADRAAEYVGSTYNYWGIVRQARFQMHSVVCDLLPEAQANACRRFVGYVDLGRGSGREFFCSELVVAAYEAAGAPITDTPPNWTTPDDLAQLGMTAGALAYVGHLKAPPYEARTSLWDSLGLALAASPHVRRPVMPVRASSRPLAASGLSTQHVPFQFPPAQVLSGIEQQLARGIFSAIAASVAAPLAAARSAANAQGLSLAIGPSLRTGLGGGSASAGVILAPNDQVGIYGQFDVRTRLIDSLSGEIQVTLVRGGIDAFASISYAGVVEIDPGASISVQALLDASLKFQGVSFGLGADVDVEPVQVFLAVQGGGSTGLARAQSVRPHGLGAEPFTLNWDEVQLIPQTPAMNSWTTAAASVIGWRDRVSLTPDTLALIAERTQVSGQNLGELAQFAGEIGLATEPARAYSADDFRALLERRGPLWIASQATAQAVTVTGAYADRGVVYVRVTDPQDREAGRPGAPGARSVISPTGSRYVVRWDDFAGEFGSAAPEGAVVLNVLHAGGTAGRTPNRGSPAATGHAQSRSSRALSNELFSVNWDDVEAVPQPSDTSCWAAAAAMVIGWRDRLSLTPDTLAAISGRSTTAVLDPPQVGAFASEMGLVAEPPLCYSVESFRQLLETKGPLWVGEAAPRLHVVVVTGLYLDGTDTYVRITDPWDRVTGTPGAPGPRLATHTTGSRYIMKWADFVAEFEAASANFPAVNLQILHAGGIDGRTPNYGSATSAGYAQAASRAVGRFEHAFDAAPATPPPAAAAPRRRQEAGAAEAVQWRLDQYDGLRLPAMPGLAITVAGTRSVRLDDWPFVRVQDGQVQLPLSVSWCYDRGAIGDVVVTPGVMHTLPGWTLSVNATIADGPDTPGLAAASVRVEHVFAQGPDTPVVGVTELTLFGDGTYQRRDRWEQAAA